jgi:hypothetical protein
MEIVIVGTFKIKPVNPESLIIKIATVTGITKDYTDYFCKDCVINTFVLGIIKTTVYEIQQMYFMSQDLPKESAKIDTTIAHLKMTVEAIKSPFLIKITFY